MACLCSGDFLPSHSKARLTGSESCHGAKDLCADLSKKRSELQTHDSCTYIPTYSMHEQALKLQLNDMALKHSDATVALSLMQDQRVHQAFWLFFG